MASKAKDLPAPPADPRKKVTKTVFAALVASTSSAIGLFALRNANKKKRTASNALEESAPAAKQARIETIEPGEIPAHSQLMLPLANTTGVPDSVLAATMNGDLDFLQSYISLRKMGKGNIDAHMAASIISALGPGAMERLLINNAGPSPAGPFVPLPTPTEPSAPEKGKGRAFLAPKSTKPKREVKHIVPAKKGTKTLQVIFKEAVHPNEVHSDKSIAASIASIFLLTLVTIAAKKREKPETAGYINPVDEIIRVAKSNVLEIRFKARPMDICRGLL